MALRAEPTGAYQDSVLVGAPARPERGRISSGLGREARLAYALLIPSLLVVLGFVAYPFLAGISMSFQNKMVGGVGRFVGFANYAELFRNEVFLRTVYNSVVYTGVAVALKFLLGLTMALVLDQERRFWCYGGKMVEADNKTVVMNSPGSVAGVKVIEAMFKTHKIIPPGAISWDDSGNNKAYQSGQAAFVMNPTSIYAYLNQSDQELQKKTGLFPVPAGPKGTINQIDTWTFGAFKKSPYPDLAKGLIDYFMQPANYDRVIQSTGGRWVPVYKRLFDSPFWREKPVFKHFIQMAETGVPVSYAGTPTPAAGEVLNTHLIGKMIQRVLVENWPAEKALEECHKNIAEVYARYKA